MTRGIVTGGAALAATLAWSLPVGAEAPDVVASINPVHSLVASVMAGVGTPVLLLKGGGSPHAYSLRPSEARALSRAQVIFWIGDDLETFLEKPLATLGDKAHMVALAKAPGITLLKTREGGVWERGAEHADEAASGEDHDDEHVLGAYDMHLWLDPANAKAMVASIVTALSTADRENATAYHKNGAATAAALDALDSALRRDLESVKAKPYVVFHDAYQYFERRYGLTDAGSVTVSPDRAPGAKRLSEIRKKVLASNARCVFTEPQFAPRLVDTVIDGTPAKAAELDPLGAAIEPGPDAYPSLLRNLATSLRTCLGATN